MMKYDYIQGEKFYGVADFIFAPNIKPKFEDYNKIINTFDINKLRDVNIIYCHTLYVDVLFNTINNLNKSFIVVTHNSDINIDNKFSLPENVIKWYSQNINIDNDKIESIPIGLQNNRWFITQNKIKLIDEKINEEKKHKNWVYINHSIRTNPEKRQKPYDIFKGVDWVTLEYGKEGIDFTNYLNMVYNHKFVICPEGNGIDTHRTWECLYLKTIPIEKINNNNKYYRDLPICFVNDWDDINLNFLEKEYFRISNSEWNLDKLNFSFWKNKIINTNKKYE